MGYANNQVTFSFLIETNHVRSSGITYTLGSLSEKQYKSMDGL